MATSAVTVAINDNWYDGKRQHVVSTLTVGSGNYLTNGLPVSWLLPLIKSATSPVWVMLLGIAGFNYAWDFTNLTMRIFQSAGFTPNGTVAAPVMNTVNDSGSPTKTLGELGGALSTNGAVSNLTGIQAPAFTGTPQAAAGESELLNGGAVPSGVTGDTIKAYSIFKII